MSYIDLHAHVLPGVDDGAETLEASLMMLRMASEHGTKALAVTPHGAGVTKTQYLGKFEHLKAAAARESLPVKLFFGMEMMADGTLFDRLQSGDVQPLGESRFLLVEFDPLDSSEWCAAATEHIRKYGYVPLIAHPERYVILQNEPWRAELWTERGGRAAGDAQRYFRRFRAQGGRDRAGAAGARSGFLRGERRARDRVPQTDFGGRERVAHGALRCCVCRADAA